MSHTSSSQGFAFCFPAAFADKVKGVVLVADEPGAAAAVQDEDAASLFISPASSRSFLLYSLTMLLLSAPGRFCNVSHVVASCPNHRIW